jgi:hypothetical protein
MILNASVAVLRDGESLLGTDDAVAGLLEMLDAHVVLERYGPSAYALYTRSWLVVALEDAGLDEQAASLRSRGPVVRYPRAVLPSVWYVSLLDEPGSPVGAATENRRPRSRCAAS